MSYHRLYTWKSPTKDSVNVNIILKNLENKSLDSFAAFMKYRGKYIEKRTTNKKLSFRLKKEANVLKLAINHYFKSYEFEINTLVNYNIIVNIDDSNKVIPIINNIEKFKIIKNNDSLLYFKRYDNKIIKLAKKQNDKNSFK